MAAKNAKDARARAIGMHKGTSLALKAKVVVQDKDDETQEDLSHWHPKELEELSRTIRLSHLKPFGRVRPRQRNLLTSQ